MINFVDPPSNIAPSSDLNITAPTKLTSNCSADGKPKPTVTRTRLSDNTEVPRHLNITGKEDAGRFRCTAANGFGIPLTKVVFVNVLPQNFNKEN